MDNSRLRREQDILDRLENVKRLIEMENTIMTVEGAKKYASYCMVGKDGSRIGSYSDNLLYNLQNEIQLQLLSIVALCYGDNPDIGDPYPMLEWVRGLDENAEDKFHDVWEKCLKWTV